MTTAQKPGIDLADRLREATRSLHTRAERSGIMRDLLARRVTRADYCTLLANLHAIYSALEIVLSSHDADPSIAPVVNPELFRRAAIEMDLTMLCGPDWAQHVSIAAAAGAYVDRLRTIDNEDAFRIIAHAYVRYLGDLNGGQMLQPIVRSALQLDGTEGTRFYCFDVADAAACARDYRATLNALALPPKAVEAIVDEACWAFQQHITLFDELANRQR